METSKKKRKIFRSRTEFEREYFPKSFAKRMVREPSEARALGAALARESFDKVKQEFGT